jgi:hypothetical protein
MKLARIRVRTAMIAVGILGAMLGGLVEVQSRRHSARYRALCAFHRDREKRFREIARLFPLVIKNKVARTYSPTTGLTLKESQRTALRLHQRDLRYLAERADYHRRLRMKYTDALAHPLVRVDPDPPPPIDPR